jgi:hypothetical protein
MIGETGKVILRYYFQTISQPQSLSILNSIVGNTTDQIFFRTRSEAILFNTYTDGGGKTHTCAGDKYLCRSGSGSHVA